MYSAIFFFRDETRALSPLHLRFAALVLVRRLQHGLFPSSMRRSTMELRVGARPRLSCVAYRAQMLPRLRVVRFARGFCGQRAIALSTSPRPYARVSSQPVRTDMRAFIAKRLPCLSGTSSYLEFLQCGPAAVLSLPG